MSFIPALPPHNTVTPETLSLELATYISQQLFFEMPFVQTDVGIVLGSYKRGQALAELAAESYHRGAFRTLIVSGGTWVPNQGVREFYDITRTLLTQGVPREAIITEETATNTGQNIVRSLELAPVETSSFTIICSTPHTRRALATLRRYNKTAIATVTSCFDGARHGVTKDNWYRPSSADMEFEKIRQQVCISILKEYDRMLAPHSDHEGQPLYYGNGFCVPINRHAEYRLASSLPPVPAPRLLLT